MLLKTLKSNRAVNFILFPLMGLLLWFKSLIYPQTYPFYLGETDNLLYSPVHLFLGKFPFFQNLAAWVLLILMASFILQINNRYNFLRMRTILPAFLFILIVSGFTELHLLHPVYFSALFLLFAIFRLFSAFDQNRPYSSAFDSGFFLGIASLFYFNVIFLFPAFFIGISILSRETKWREVLLNFIGFLLPFILAISYAFLTDQMLALLKVFERNIFTQNNFFKNNIPLQVYTGFLFLMIALGSIKIIQQYDTKKVSTRKFFIVFLFLFLFSVLNFVFIPATSQEIFVITAIPVTFLMSNFFIFTKSRFWSEFWFSLLFLMVIILQITG